MAGARAGYEIHGPASQENSASSKPPSLSGSYRQHSGPRSRMPLSNVTANTHQGDTSRRGSEADRHQQQQQQQQDAHSRNSSANVGARLLDNDIPENMWRPEEDDPDGWIHRDKLAKIESEELQAAGIGLATRRQYGRSGRRGSSRDRKADEPAVSDRREEKKARLAESALTEEDGDGDGDGDEERKTWDLRTPDEIAAEPGMVPGPLGSPASSVVKKTGGSRIPVLASSPHPIPSERLERETPLPRKRTMSNSMSAEEALSWLGDKKHTYKNNSTAEDSPRVDGNSGGSLSASPTKQRSASSGSPTSRRITPTAAATAAAAGRKNGAAPKFSPVPNAAGEKAAPTGSSNEQEQQQQQQQQQQRPPQVKSQEPDRPRTAINRPEGDPPWLATMYKPDPRLPPDQQIIPTHARMQQVAQWEAAGAVPKTYDRNFQPLEVHDAEALARPAGLSPAQSTEAGAGAGAGAGGAAASTTTPTTSAQPATWPLKPTANAKTNENSSRPGTGTSTIGGYSTMPKVVNVPGGQGPRANAPLRLQEPTLDVGAGEKDGDDGTVKKGCACCVVM